MVKRPRTRSASSSAYAGNRCIKPVSELRTVRKTKIAVRECAVHGAYKRVIMVVPRSIIIVGVPCERQ